MIPTVEFPPGVHVLLKSTGTGMFDVVNQLSLGTQLDAVRTGAITYTDTRFDDYFA